MAVIAAAILALPTPVSAQEVVTNGGFETGDFSGWTLFGTTSFTEVVLSSGAHSGSYYAGFGPVTPSGIQQTLTTVPGESYEISFWLQNLAGGAPNSFSVSFDGDILMSTASAPDFPYTLYSFTRTAATTSTLLSFTFVNDPRLYRLDDVSVSGSGAVPEPGTWATMLLGFSVTGFALRRRRVAQRSRLVAQASH
jgi:hypothetical protein